jgi:hypothetical protein
MPPEPETPPFRVRWNQVTWYSKLGAIVVFLGVIPALCFYIGMQYQVVIKETDISPIASPSVIKNDIRQPQVAETKTRYVDFSTYPLGCTTLAPEIIGWPDLSKGAVCRFRINEKLPTYNFFYTTESIDVVRSGENEPIQRIDFGDALPGAQNYLDAMDLNFDSYKDLLVGVTEGMHGNTDYEVYAFSSSTGKFERMGSITNPVPDPKTKTIESEDCCSQAGAGWTKYTYTVGPDNKFVKIREVDQWEDEEAQAVLRVTKEFKNGNLISVSTTTIETSDHTGGQFEAPFPSAE